MFGLFRSTSTSTRAVAARFRPRLFARREDGTVTAFSLMIFVLMVGVSGIAIDVMRFETQRAQLQYTMDRAILAAASLTQPFDPEGVVRNYFSVAGIENYRLDVRVEEGLNFRRVHAYAEIDVQSMFLQIFGVRSLSTPAIGAAEERVRNIEVSMVLDISGSMNGSRMNNMRPAARDFVTEVLQANTNVNDELLVSISLVPYNDVVNTGPTIASVFAFDDTHNEATCARFVPSDYTTTAIDPAVPLRRIADFDYSRRRNDSPHIVPYCVNITSSYILPWEDNQTTLHTAINRLNPGGNTGIDVGMRWGVALLDPAANPAVRDLVAAGTVDPDFIARPAPFLDGNPNTLLDDETIKVVVLMTDGENTSQQDLADVFYNNNSPIFLDNSTGQYSIWWEDEGQFWIPDGNPRSANGSWQSAPDGGWGRYGITPEDFNTFGPNAYDPSHTGAGTVLSWQSLFSAYTATYIAEEWLRVPADESGHWDLFTLVRYNSVNSFASWTGSMEPGQRNPADDNLMAICDAARAAGIVVFSIGFEAPTNAQTVMEYCAHTDAHYYDVDGIEISQAFSSIAQTINQLRLIQ